MKVSAEKYVEGVNSIYVEKPSYELGHDGSDGKCDCIGMCRGGLERAGATGVTNMRGTNQAARRAIADLRKLDAGQLRLGEVVLKVRDKDDPDMPLPDRYRKGGADYDPDVGEINFTHIGTVTRENPVEITHMTSPTAKKDTSTKGWTWSGRLPWVDGGGGEVQKGIVTAESGSTVNLRKQPAASAALIERVPVGTPCEIVSEDGEWSKIIVDGVAGWMMSRFIQKDAPGPEPEPGGTVTITLTEAEAAAAWPALQSICEQIIKTVGRG